MSGVPALPAQLDVAPDLRPLRANLAKNGALLEQHLKFIPAGPIPMSKLLQLHNTATRSKQTFTPMREDAVGLYVCGRAIHLRSFAGLA